MTNEKRYGYIIWVSYITLIVNTILAILKIVFGLLGRSFAVVSDGIDSSTDVLISIIALITTYISQKPPDTIHVFGHKRAETIGTKILSFIILFAGIQLFITAFAKLIGGEVTQIPNYATVIVILISIIGKSTTTCKAGGLSNPKRD
ncbi:MAG TPA: cation diffusion facilitator family transporter, partial [Spirochaetota bacterium]|nr:cation diffusion facilitator family transporter [Spirochaetota bacterium]